VKPRWWETASEKAIVAAATAFITGLVAVAGPPVKNWAYAVINHTDGATADETAFQASRWARNPQCGVSQTLWHPASSERQIDATICPGTGDILVVMRDEWGRQLQWWPDLQGLTRQFNAPQGGPVQLSFLEGTAVAAVPVSIVRPAGQQVAQAVICQMFMPDGRTLRRRLQVGPNQCIEVIIDSYTGKVLSQRSIPCISNCAAAA
jgi:hypothetical protein